MEIVWGVNKVYYEMGENRQWFIRKHAITFYIKS